MKITDVQACVIGRQEPHSGGSVWTFVRVYTDEGIVGTGECNSAGPSTSGFATKEAVLAMKPLLVGQDPTNTGQHRNMEFHVNCSMNIKKPCESRAYYF